MAKRNDPRNVSGGVADARTSIVNPEYFSGPARDSFAEEIDQREQQKRRLAAHSRDVYRTQVKEYNDRVDRYQDKVSTHHKKWKRQAEEIGMEVETDLDRGGYRQKTDEKGRFLYKEQDWTFRDGGERMGKHEFRRDRYGKVDYRAPSVFENESDETDPFLYMEDGSRVGHVKDVLSNPVIPEHWKERAEKLQEKRRKVRTEMVGQFYDNQVNQATVNKIKAKSELDKLSERRSQLAQQISMLEEDPEFDSREGGFFGIGGTLTDDAKSVRGQYEKLSSEAQDLDTRIMDLDASLSKDGELSKAESKARDLKKYASAYSELNAQDSMLKQRMDILREQGVPEQKIAQDPLVQSLERKREEYGVKLSQAEREAEIEREQIQEAVKSVNIDVDEESSFMDIIEEREELNQDILAFNKAAEDIGRRIEGAKPEQAQGLRKERTEMRMRAAMLEERHAKLQSVMESPEVYWRKKVELVAPEGEKVDPLQQAMVYDARMRSIQKILDSDQTALKSRTGKQREAQWLQKRMDEHVAGMSKGQREKFEEFNRDPKAYEVAWAGAGSALGTGLGTLLDSAIWLGRASDKVNPTSWIAAAMGKKSPTSQVVELWEESSDQMAGWGKNVGNEYVMQKINDMNLSPVMRSGLHISPTMMGDGVGSMAAFWAPGAIVGKSVQAMRLGSKALPKLMNFLTKNAGVGTTSGIGATSMSELMMKEVEAADEARIRILKEGVDSGEITQDQFDESYREIIDSQDTRKAWGGLVGFIGGASEAVPLAKFIRFADDAGQDRFTNWLVRKLVSDEGDDAARWMSRRGKKQLAASMTNIISQGGEEAVQEYIQTLWSNSWAKGNLLGADLDKALGGAGYESWDPDRGTLEGVPEGSTLGGFLGMLMQTASEMGGVRGRRKYRRAMADARVENANKLRKSILDNANTVEKMLQNSEELPGSVDAITVAALGGAGRLRAMIDEARASVGEDIELDDKAKFEEETSRRSAWATEVFQNTSSHAQRVQGSKSLLLDARSIISDIEGNLIEEQQRTGGYPSKSAQVRRDAAMGIIKTLLEDGESKGASDAELQAVQQLQETLGVDVFVDYKGFTLVSDKASEFMKSQSGSADKIFSRTEAEEKSRIDEMLEEQSQLDQQQQEGQPEGQEEGQPEEQQEGEPEGGFQAAVRFRRPDGGGDDMVRIPKGATLESGDPVTQDNVTEWLGEQGESVESVLAYHERALPKEEATKEPEAEQEQPAQPTFVDRIKPSRLVDALVEREGGEVTPERMKQHRRNANTVGKMVNAEVDAYRSVLGEDMVVVQEEGTGQSGGFHLDEAGRIVVSIADIMNEGNFDAIVEKPQRIRKLMQEEVIHMEAVQRLGQEPASMWKELPDETKKAFSSVYPGVDSDFAAGHEFLRAIVQGRLALQDGVFNLDGKAISEDTLPNTQIMRFGRAFKKLHDHFKDLSGKLKADGASDNAIKHVNDLTNEVRKHMLRFHAELEGPAGGNTASRSRDDEDSGRDRTESEVSASDGGETGGGDSSASPSSGREKVELEVHKGEQLKGLSKPGYFGRKTAIDLADQTSKPARFALVEESDIVEHPENTKGTMNDSDTRDFVEKAYQREGLSERKAFADDPTFQSGPPVVRIQDGKATILGGHRRTYIRRYKDIPQAYQEALPKHLSKFGLSQEDAAKMENPVIVAVTNTREGTAEEKRIVSLLNKSHQQGVAAEFTATAAARSAPEEFFERVGEFMNNNPDSTLMEALRKPNAWELTDWITKNGVFDDVELKTIINSDTGRFSETGARFIRDMLIARIVDDPLSMRRIADTKLNGIIQRGIGQLIQMQQRGENFDVIQEAFAREADRLIGINGKVVSAEEYIAQQDMTKEVNPQVDAFQLWLSAQSGNTIRDGLQKLISEYLPNEDAGQGALLGNDNIGVAEGLYQRYRESGQVLDGPSNLSPRLKNDSESDDGGDGNWFISRQESESTPGTAPTRPLSFTKKGKLKIQTDSDLQRANLHLPPKHPGARVTENAPEVKIPKRGTKDFNRNKVAKAALMMPSFQGYKREMAHHIDPLIKKHFTEEQRENITVVNDYFGGGGSWGAFLTRMHFPNVEQVRVHEFDPVRMQKIRYFHERGDEFGDLMDDFIDTTITAEIYSALEKGTVDQGQDLGIEGLAPSEQAYSEHSYKDFIENLAANLGIENLTNFNPAEVGLSDDQAIVVKAMFDHISNKWSFGSKDGGEMDTDTKLETLRDELVETARNAKEGIDLLKERGVDFDYIGGESSYEQNPMEGDHVLSVMDPPYYKTAGYDGSVVGLPIYEQTGQMLQRVREAGNSMIYTDEAWWLDDVEADSDQSGALGGTEGGLVQDWNVLNASLNAVGNAYHVPVASRHEVLGIHNAQNPSSNTGEVLNSQYAKRFDNESGQVQLWERNVAPLTGSRESSETTGASGLEGASSKAGRASGTDSDGDSLQGEQGLESGDSRTPGEVGSGQEDSGVNYSAGRGRLNSSQADAQGMIRAFVRRAKDARGQDPSVGVGITGHSDTRWHVNTKIRHILQNFDSSVFDQSIASQTELGNQDAVDRLTAKKEDMERKALIATDAINDIFAAFPKDQVSTNLQNGKQANPYEAAEMYFKDGDASRAEDAFRHLMSIYDSSGIYMQDLVNLVELGIQNGASLSMNLLNSLNLEARGTTVASLRVNGPELFSQPAEPKGQRVLRVLGTKVSEYHDSHKNENQPLSELGEMGRKASMALARGILGRNFDGLRNSVAAMREAANEYFRLAMEGETEQKAFYYKPSAATWRRSEDINDARYKESKDYVDAYMRRDWDGLEAMNVGAGYTQRGGPESKMMDVQESLASVGMYGVFTNLLEHIGDLAHRATTTNGMGMVDDKLKLVENTLSPKRWDLEKELDEALKNAPGFIKDGAEPLNSQKAEETPSFYSRLEQVMFDKLGKSAKVEQVKGMLAKGVAPKEEVKWSGIIPWLEQNADDSGRISKEALMGYLRDAGAVRIEEVVFGEGRRDEYDAIQFSELSDDVQKLVPGHDLARSGDWVLLENGRPSFLIGEAESRDAALGVVDNITEQDTGERLTSRARYENLSIPGGENYRELILRMPLSEPMYETQHYADVPNYVAHMRLDDRTDDFGRGTLIQEVQSDRHSDGSKRGYRGNELTDPERMAQLKKNFNRILSKVDFLGLNNIVQAAGAIRQSQDWASRWDVSDLSDQEIQDVNDWRAAVINDQANASGVPDAPYRKDWPVQLFKRALRDAVSKGHKWVAWTDAATQANRYNNALQDRVHSINWQKVGGDSRNGKVTVENYTKGPIEMVYDDSGVVMSATADNRAGVRGKHLREVVGGKIADQILSKPEGKVEGDDLMVGSQHFRMIYNSEETKGGLPRQVQKYVKQWGAKVQKGKIWAEPYSLMSEEAMDRVEINDEGEVEYGVWRVDITPQMEASVRAEGQPLFSQAASYEQAGFYSHMEGKLADIQGRRATVNQIRGALAKGGVKAEEIKWSGVREVLDEISDEKGMVVMSELQERMRELGRTNFREVLLGDRPGVANWNETTLEVAGEEFTVYNQDGRWAVVDEHRGVTVESGFDEQQEAREAAERHARVNYGATEITVGDVYGPQFNEESLVLDGGSNYRELVLTSPNRDGLQLRRGLEMRETEGGWNIWDSHGFAPGWVFRNDFSSREALERAAATDEMLASVDSASNYTSPHYSNIPNYVAHMRMNERPDESGAPGLFIEEFQSDRHQQGRDKGYRENTDAIKASYRKIADDAEVKEVERQFLGGSIIEYQASTGDFVGPNAATHESARQGLYSKMIRSAKVDSGIPDAPFRKDWAVQLFKRGLRDAVKSNKSWVGWTNGEVQADRYDLSKRVERIDYRDNRESGGGIDVAAVPLGAEFPPADFNKTELTIEEVAEFVGKDIAAKIDAKGGEAVGKTGKRRLKGENLKVGGQGMRKFYDAMLPSMVSKYVKKQWGGKVTKGHIDGRLGGWVVRNTHTGDYFSDKVFKSKRDVEIANRQWGNPALSENYEITQVVEEKIPIWKVDITPAMRKGVEEQGQPLFSQKADPVQEYHRHSYDLGNILDLADIDQHLGKPTEGPAALKGFAMATFYEANAMTPGDKRNQALIKFLDRLPVSEEDRIYRVLGFETEEDAKAYVAGIGFRGVRQRNPFSNWTAADPLSESATPMNHIGLDVASQFGPHKVILDMSNAKALKGRDISFVYSSTRPPWGTDIVVQNGAQAKMVGYEQRGLTHVVRLEGGQAEGAGLFSQKAEKPKSALEFEQAFEASKVDPDKFRDNMKLAYYMAHKWKKSLPSWSQDELEQEALMALWNAAQKFDPNGKNKFGTYASRAIRFRFINHFRKQKLFNSRYTIDSLDAPIGEGEDGDIQTLHDTLSDEGQFEAQLAAEAAETRAVLWDVLRELEEKTQDVIIDFTRGASFVQIAKDYGETKQAMAARYNKGIDKIRTKLKVRGYVDYDGRSLVRAEEGATDGVEAMGLERVQAFVGGIAEDYVEPAGDTLFGNEPLESNDPKKKRRAKAAKKEESDEGDTSAEQGMLFSGRAMNRHEVFMANAIAEPLMSGKPDDPVGKSIDDMMARLGRSDTISDTFSTAEQEESGKRTVGRPDLAVPVEDETGRRFVSAVDEEMKSSARRQEQALWNQQARARVQADKQGELERLLEQAQNPSFNGLPTAVDVKIAQILVEDMVGRAVSTRDPGLMSKAEQLTRAYRMSGSELGRAMAARFDPFKSRAQRNKEFLAQMVFRPSKKDEKRAENALSGNAKTKRIRSLEKQISDLQARAAEPNADPVTQRELVRLRKELRKAQGVETKDDILTESMQNRMTKIEKALAKMGVTLDDIFSERVEVRISAEAVIQEYSKHLDAKRKRAVRMTMDRRSMEEIMAKTGLSAADISDMDRDFEAAYRRAHMAKYIAQVEHQAKNAEGREDIHVDSLLRSGAAVDRDTIVKMAERALANDVASLGFGVRGRKAIVRRRSVGRNSPRGRRTKDRPQSLNRPASEYEWELDNPKDNRRHWNKPFQRDLSDPGLPPNVSGYVDLENVDDVIKIYKVINSVDGNAQDMIREFWINSILSGPHTQIANITGNAISTAFDMFARRTMEGVLADGLRASGVEVKNGAYSGEFNMMMKAMVPSFLQAMKDAKNSWDNETSFFRPRFLNEQVEMDNMGRLEYVKRAIPGIFGTIVRTPGGRSLLFMDEFFKHFIARTNVGAMAYRQGRNAGLKGDKLQKHIEKEVSIYGSSAWEMAVDKAEELTFTNDPKPKGEEGGGFGISHAAMEMSAPIRRNFWGGFVIPFARTLVNLFAMGLRMSPLGAANMGLRTLGAGVHAATGKGKFQDRYSRAERIRDLGEQMIAWSAAAALFPAVEGDDDDDEKWFMMTGSRPFSSTTYGVSKLYNRTGLPAYSMRFGDFVFQYGRYEPISTALGLFADTARLVKEGNKLDGNEAMGEMVASLASNLTDKTFAKGLSDISSLVQEPNREAANYFSNLAASWVPNLIRQPMRVADPMVRESSMESSAKQFVGRFAERTVESALPIPSTRAVEIDIWGREVEKEGNMASRLLVPQRVGNMKQRLTRPDKVLLAWNRQNPGDKYAPQPVSRRVETADKDEPYYMNDEEFVEFQKDAGRRSLDLIGRIPLNMANPTEQDVKRIKNAVTAGRHAARQAFRRKKGLSL